MSQPDNEVIAPGLGKRLTELREARGFTQRQLAEKAGLSAAFLSEVENGKRNLSSGKLLRLADELGGSLDYLMRGEQAPVRGRTPVEIPPELDDMAQEQGWSYQEASALLQARHLIKARRSPGGSDVPKVYNKEDWLDLYKRLFE
jgi:transcriptional regulator with XRE-family HTH domain